MLEIVVACWAPYEKYACYLDLKLDSIELFFRAAEGSIAPDLGGEGRTDES